MLDGTQQLAQSAMELQFSSDVPLLSHGSLATMRAAIKAAMDATGKDMKRDGGLQILQPNDRQAAEDLLAQLRAYGIFVVPGASLSLG